MYFPSKKDRWLSIILWGVSLVGIIIPLITGSILTVIFTVPLAIILLWFWFRTGYLIEEDKIKVRYGPIRQTVNIKEIKRIHKRKLPLSAPALSMDRIEIMCSKFNVVTISPENQEKFIETLLAINPAIKLDDHLKEKIQSKRR
ncbi:PH domain-containing protein [Oceanobacillus halotolerans]|uniref:PH domain-containing protein n=1 Tax=Oceanobacillus halotolerans TaxID=2663380 RepID=UPI0013DC941D|nr:PH domain-containing protein [Oceanobacillus halotolerans]